MIRLIHIYAGLCGPVNYCIRQQNKPFFILLEGNVMAAMVLCHQKRYNNPILYYVYVFLDPTKVKFIHNYPILTLDQVWQRLTQQYIDLTSFFSYNISNKTTMFLFEKSKSIKIIEICEVNNKPHINYAWLKWNSWADQ